MKYIDRFISVVYEDGKDLININQPAEQPLIALEEHTICRNKDNVMHFYLLKIFLCPVLGRKQNLKLGWPSADLIHL